MDRITEIRSLIRDLGNGGGGPYRKPHRCHARDACDNEPDHRPQGRTEPEHDGILFSRLSLLFLDSKLEGNNRIHTVPFQRFFSLRGSSPRGNDGPGPRSACPIRELTGICFPFRTRQQGS